MAPEEPEEPVAPEDPLEPEDPDEDCILKFDIVALPAIPL